MGEEIRIGLVGLDTSHVIAFTRILHDTRDAFHVPGARVVAGYPGGSPDMERSSSRVGQYTEELRDRYGVAIVDSIEAVVEASDAVCLESVDGRVHLEQFRRIAPSAKPTFIDKPFATSAADAGAIAQLARTHRVPLMSCSALRYAQPLTEALADDSAGEIIGIDCAGPMEIEPTQPGLFWYGIHAVEMAYAALGAGCEHLTGLTSDDHDAVCGVWNDGRIALIRGNRRGNTSFTAVVHRERESRFVNASAGRKPYYASLVESILNMVRSGRPPFDVEETVEIVRFIEEANALRDSGRKSPPRPLSR